MAEESGYSMAGLLVVHLADQSVCKMVSSLVAELEP